ncbi:MAG: PIN domain-containing protein [Bacillota bacterium]
MKPLFFMPSSRPARELDAPQRLVPKVLDTNVLIDGRILDIVKAGFLEGPLVVPGFVLDELRHIADSTDSLRRTRGRRGLDVVEALRTARVGVEIRPSPPSDLAVDVQLINLAESLAGKVVTNDLNLSKVARIRGVEVLSIHELAKAVQIPVLPGDEIELQIIRDGKVHGQGVGYLDDGTMIVVEGGRKFIGQKIHAVITKILQNEAGRMIFAKPQQRFG